MFIFINEHIDNITKNTIYYTSFDDIEIDDVSDVKMIYLCYTTTDYRIFSYEFLLKFTNLTHLWLFSNIDKNCMVLDITFYNFMNKINLLTQLETLCLCGYVIEDIMFMRQNPELRKPLITSFNNLPTGLKKLCFEINLPAKNIDEIDFNCPITMENIEIILSRCWTNEFDTHKNRIKINKLPFQTKYTIHFSTHISKYDIIEYDIIETIS